MYPFVSLDVRKILNLLKLGNFKYLNNSILKKKKEKKSGQTRLLTLMGSCGGRGELD